VPILALGPGLGVLMQEALFQNPYYTIYRIIRILAIGRNEMEKGRDAFPAVGILSRPFELQEVLPTPA